MAASQMRPLRDGGGEKRDEQRDGERQHGDGEIAPAVV